ncbi:Coiled-coil domain containing 28A [Sparganum proliferum]
MARATDVEKVLEALAVISEVKQGCVLTPTLFIPMSSDVSMDVYLDEHPRIGIVYRTDGQLLNTRRIQTPANPTATTVQYLLFAVDGALNTVTEPGMRRSVNLFAAGRSNFGLTINMDRTVIMHQPSPDIEYNAHRTTVNGTHHKIVDNFEINEKAHYRFH